MWDGNFPGGQGYNLKCKMMVLTYDEIQIKKSGTKTPLGNGNAIREMQNESKTNDKYTT